MARIVFGSYMVRYPLGGMMSYVLQYLVGFQRLGHDVWLVERAGYPDSCFHPLRGTMSDDCAYGTATVHRLLGRFGLEGRWCFVDAGGRYHGASRSRIREVFRSADLFVDMGTHGAWMEEAAECGARVLIDGEPGYNQIRMESGRAAGEAWEAFSGYDAYYTNGMNVGTAASTAPTGGREWRHIFHPVATELFPPLPPAADAAVTTVMNWRSHDPVRFQGREYGQKDVEFARFLALPRRVDQPLEVAVAGAVPEAELRSAGWRLRDAHRVTVSYDAFVGYLRSSLAEFTVCKNVFVEMRTGWFSDRSAAYLALGRPVIMQDTGFSDHLPTGEGLFAVPDVEGAAEAIRRVAAEPDRHGRAARRIAEEHLDARIVLGRFLSQLGV